MPAHASERQGHVCSCSRTAIAALAAIKRLFTVSISTVSNLSSRGPLSLLLSLIKCQAAWGRMICESVLYL